MLCSRYHNLLLNNKSEECGAQANVWIVQKRLGVPIPALQEAPSECSYEPEPPQMLVLLLQASPLDFPLHLVVSQFRLPSDNPYVYATGEGTQL